MGSEILALVSVFMLPSPLSLPSPRCGTVLVVVGARVIEHSTAQQHANSRLHFSKPVA